MFADKHCSQKGWFSWKDAKSGMDRARGKMFQLETTKVQGQAGDGLGLGELQLWHGRG